MGKAEAGPMSRVWKVPGPKPRAEVAIGRVRTGSGSLEKSGFDINDGPADSASSGSTHSGAGGYAWLLRPLRGGRLRTSATLWLG